MLERLMRSRAEVNVFGIVLFNENLHLREIARRAHISASEAKRELDNLLELGILKSQKAGNLVVFTTNPKSPFLQELKSLYMKTEGVFGQLQQALSNANGIKYAFVYGSMASDRFREKSDLDLFIIGSADERQIASACLKVQKESGREVNFILWDESDFIKKLKEENSFVRTVIKNKKIWLVGEQNEFEGIVAKTLYRKD